jgi:hypothetical protein
MCNLYECLYCLYTLYINYTQRLRHESASPPRGSQTVVNGQGDAPERVIESYSCALYSSGLPMHGRLSISSDLVHFAGWRSSKFDLPLAGILLDSLAL